MKHYLKKLEESTKKCWERRSLCNYGGEAYTYGRVATLIEQMHIAFGSIGIKKGDKIALCARNSARWAIAFWSANTYEAVAVPILADFTPESIMNITDHSDSLVLFTDADIFKNLDTTRLPKLKAIINVADFSLLYACNEDVKKAYNSHEEVFADKYPAGFTPADVSYPTDNWDDVAIINYTSGTTSDPKGVMLTYKAMSDTDEFSNAHFPNTPEYTMISMLPLAHMYGLAIEFIHPNVDGVAVYFLGKTPTPTTLMKAMAEVKPYMVVTVPLVMEKIYKKSLKPALESGPVKVLTAIPGLKNVIYKKVRDKLLAAFGGRVQCFIMGGAALNPEVEACFKKIKLPYTVGYGMTEACPLLGFEWWEDFVSGSCGKPVHDLRIDSEDPINVPGEIQVRGDNITVGYYKNPEANAAAYTDDGWFRTGDLGVQDADGNIFIRGRIKSMFLSASGQNIYPEEIEAVVGYHDGVAECLAVWRGDRIAVLVYPDADFTAAMGQEEKADWAEKLRLSANKQLPSYSQIAKVELQEKPFEKTPKMSIRRFLYK